MTISGAIDPPQWWVDRLRGRVKVGAGRSPAAPGMFRQSDLLAKILDECGNAHTAPEMSRAMKGERIPIQLAIDLSDVLKIPAPIYVSTSEEEAGRMESQRAVSRLLLAAADRFESQLADTNPRSGKSAKASQTPVVKPPSGEEKPASRRGQTS